MGISPSESGGASVPPRLDTSSAHSARVWNYLLGGKDNFAADREVGDMILQMFPGIAHIARLQRRFLGRAVRYLAGEAGIRQFLDIGTGLPTADNTHQIAQQVAPESRIVYNQNSASSYHLRSPEEIARFFDGLTLVPPGVVATSRWRPNLADASVEPREVDATCGVGRKD